MDDPNFANNNPGVSMWKAVQKTLANPRRLWQVVTDVVLNETRNDGVYNSLNNFVNGLNDRSVVNGRFNADVIEKKSPSMGVVCQIVNRYLDHWGATSTALCQVYDHPGSPGKKETRTQESHDIITRVPADLAPLEANEVPRDPLTESPTTLCKVYNHPLSPLKQIEESNRQEQAILTENLRKSNTFEQPEPEGYIEHSTPPEPVKQPQSPYKRSPTKNSLERSKTFGKESV